MFVVQTTSALVVAQSQYGSSQWHPVAVVVYDKKSYGGMTKATKFALLVNIIQLAILMFIGPPEK